MATINLQHPLVYQPLGAALDLMACDAGEVLVEGPAGTGKSRAALEKAHLVATMYEGVRVLLVRKTRRSMTESVLVTFEGTVLPTGHPAGSGPARRMRLAYDYPNGSSIVLAGMDRSTKIMSTEFDMICAFEATELEERDWERLLSRLRHGRLPYQQAIADCNPASAGHWLNRRAARGQMVRLLSRHTDNPRLWDGANWTAEGERYRATLARLGGARYARLAQGQWVSSDTRVYDAFDPAVHVVKPFRIPPDWRRLCSIDFGYVNPMVCQWWAVDGDGRMWLYRELYQTRLLVEDLARKILDLSQGETLEAVVADHDAEDRATLARHGLVTSPAFKALRPGIDAVEARLRSDGSEGPRLRLLTDCLVHRDEALERRRRPQCTVEEFDQYVYSSDALRPGREAPRKEHDHGMDAMRYAVAYVDGLARDGALPLGVI